VHNVSLFDTSLTVRGGAAVDVMLGNRLGRDSKELKAGFDDVHIGRIRLANFGS
jgi:hypothetical protein